MEPLWSTHWNGCCFGSPGFTDLFLQNPVPEENRRSDVFRLLLSEATAEYTLFTEVSSYYKQVSLITLMMVPVMYQGPGCPSEKSLLTLPWYIKVLGFMSENLGCFFEKGL